MTCFYFNRYFRKIIRLVSKSLWCIEQSCQPHLWTVKEKDSTGAQSRALALHVWGAGSITGTPPQKMEVSIYLRHWDKQVRHMGDEKSFHFHFSREKYHFDLRDFWHRRARKSSTFIPYTDSHGIVPTHRDYHNLAKPNSSTQALTALVLNYQRIILTG